MAGSTKQAKLDLMQLGIELDDRLIERLQNNLGIHKIFEVARDVSHIMKTKPKLPTGAVAEMSFRYVAPEADQENNRSAAQSVNPFQKELFQLDSKTSISILRRLEDRNIDIEPQHRPHIDRMIESFQIQYGRSPERFVSRLLGQKWSMADRKNPDLIARAVLQNRFIGKDEFKGMIKRVYTPDASKHRLVDDNVLDTLFKLLCEEKQFAAAKTRVVVDLWTFLTLIKAATEESRRSYDGKTSQLATDVEFWRKANNVARSEDSRDDMSAKSIGLLDSSSGNSRRAQSAPRQRGTHPRPPFVNAKSVAELLGQEDYSSVGREDKGRGVKGTFFNELNQVSSVPAALGRIAPPNPPSPLRDHNWWVKESKVPVPPPENMLDSAKVAFLLGQSTGRPETRSVSRSRSSMHYLQREAVNLGTVAEMLGGGGEDGRWKRQMADRTPPNSPIKKKNAVAPTGDKIGSRSVPSEAPDTVDYYLDRTHAGRLHDKRKKFRSTEQLHWPDKPSVASALHPEQQR